MGPRRGPQHATDLRSRLGDDHFATTTAARCDANMSTDALDERGHVRDHPDLTAGRLKRIEHRERTVERRRVERPETLVDQERPYAHIMCRHRGQAERERE